MADAKKTVPANYLTFKILAQGKMGDRWMYYFVKVKESIVEVLVHVSRKSEVIVEGDDLSFDASELVNMQKPEGFFPNFQSLGFFEAKA